VLTKGRDHHASRRHLDARSAPFLRLPYRYFPRFCLRRSLSRRGIRHAGASVNDGQNFHPTINGCSSGIIFAANRRRGAGSSEPRACSAFGFIRAFSGSSSALVLAGSVHDFIHSRGESRGAKERSLAEIARDELALPWERSRDCHSVHHHHPLAGLGNVVVGALAESAWGVFTVGSSIPSRCSWALHLSRARRHTGAFVRRRSSGVVLLFRGAHLGQDVAIRRMHEYLSFRKISITPGHGGVRVVASVLRVASCCARGDYICRVYSMIWHHALLVLGVIHRIPPIRCRASRSGPRAAGRSSKAVSFLRVHHHRPVAHQRISRARRKRHHAQNGQRWRPIAA